MYSRLLKAPRGKSFFLFGPRGTGKTTYVKKSFPGAVYIDLLEAELFNDLLANPQRLAGLIPKSAEAWVIIDEAQKVPELLSEVHRLIENKGYKFILTGSSARKIRQRGHDLLAGRALTYSLHPLTATELGEDFNLQHALAFGHLPSACTETDPKKYLESYIQTYLREEIQQEGLARNLGAFSRFLEAASFSQASQLNISNVAQECSIERKVVENYFAILEDLLIAYRVPSFSKKAKRRVVAHPKFFFFDTGVFRTVRPTGPLDSPEEAQGAALETLFFQELLALNDYLELGYKIFFWRTAEGAEVDFVLYGPKGLIAFEIKRTGKATSSMLKNLKKFSADYPAARLFFVYGGERRLREGEIEILPIKAAFKELPVILSSAA